MNLKPQQLKNKRVIGFSARMLSGKGVISTAMKEQRGAEIVTVASALKNLIIEMFPTIFSSIYELNKKKRDGDVIDCGITDEHVKFISDKTNVPYEFVKAECDKKKSWYDVRDMLQFVGTGIIRAYNPNWHVEKLKDNIINSKADVVCVDDVRFPNERQALEDLGGETYFIIRPQSEIVSNHSSEISIRWQDFDSAHIILNETSEDELYKSFIELFDNGFMWCMESPILLSGNEYYTVQNINFGRTDSFLLQQILRQNKDSELFRKEGIITYSSNIVNDRIKFSNEVLKSNHGIEYCRNKFMLYNPLIYENLKFYL